MARRIRIRLLRDDLSALDLLSMGGFHVSPPGPGGTRRPRWRRWRRRAKPPAQRRKLRALLPMLAKKLRPRARGFRHQDVNRHH